MGPERSLDSWCGRRASKKLWQEGVLFHNFFRFPAIRDEQDVVNHLRFDRLLSILDKGLMAPAHSEDGLVVSDLNITVSDSRLAYDSLIFLHRYSQDTSFMYTLLGADDEKVMVLIDDETPFMTYDDIGDGWPVLCSDEVYVTKPIAPADFRAIYMPQRYLQEAAVRSALEPHDMPIFTY